ncbi:DUF397 domain-containing protein [Actinophytocola sediminis]
MTVPQQDQRWRKSSRSQNEGACVEIAGTLDAVRDSKSPSGPILTADLRCLVRAVTTGWLDQA